MVVEPKSPKHLGFEAQQFLVNRLDQGYDLYGYLEDDLLITDPFFFRRSIGFAVSSMIELCFFPIAMS